MGFDEKGASVDFASILDAWEKTLAQLTDADLSLLLPMLADRLPADPRGRVSAGGAL